MDVSQHIMLFEGFPEPVIVYDTDQRIISVNPAFERLSGYQQSELVGETFTSLLDDESPMPPGGADIGKTGNLDFPSPNELIFFQDKNGGRYAVELRSSLISDEEGGRLATYSVVRDISPRARILNLFERIIDRSTRGSEPLEDWFSDVLDLGCGYFDLDFGLICHGQDGTAEILQTSSGQSRYRTGATIPLNKSFCARFQGENGPLAAEAISSIAAEKSPFDQYEDYTSYIAAPICIGSDFYGMLAFVGVAERTKPFAALELAAVKILARLVAERLTDQRRNREQAHMAARLAESEARYKALFRSVPAVLVYLDEDGRIGDVTDQFVDRFGHPRDELSGKWPTDIMTASSSARAKGSAGYLFRRKGKVHNDPYELIAMSGEVVDVEITAKKQLDDTVLAAVLDVSDRNRARFELEQRNRDLERLNESLKHFTSIASHDMQEPLRKIRYFSDLLGQAVKNGNQADVDYSLRVLTDASQRASILVSDLLDFSRASNKALESEAIDLHELLEGVIGEFRREESAVAATFSLNMPHLIVSGDRTAIIQMFRNLLSNALKYRHSERAPKVDISTEISGDADAPAIISIRDNGIGFEPEYADMILKPFTRLHRRAQYPGSGVGLAICDVVARRHDWSLRAEGRPGDGATFEISIPTYFVAAD